MQVLNTKEGPMTIAGVYVIPPNSLRTFDDALWATLRERPAVKHWLERGDIKEVPAAGDGMPVIELSVITADLGTVEAGALSDPLDHDGDGRKGGSKPRKPKA